MFPYLPLIGRMFQYSPLIGAGDPSPLPAYPGRGAPGVWAGQPGDHLLPGPQHQGLGPQLHLRGGPPHRQAGQGPGPELFNFGIE